MSKMTILKKMVTLVFAMLVAYYTATGQSICDTNIYATYDRYNHVFRINYEGNGNIIIKKSDIDLIGNIKFREIKEQYVFDRASSKESFDAELGDGIFLLKYYKDYINSDPCWMKIILYEQQNTDIENTIDEQPVTTYSSETLSYLYIIIACLILVIIILTITIVVNKKRKSRQNRGHDAHNNVIAPIEEISVDKKNGLQHVYHNKNDYYVVNMNELFDDTAIKTVYFSRSIIGKLNSFFKGFLENTERTNETGCYLLGCWDYNDDSKQYDISIEHLVLPGKDAVFNEYTLNFGREIGISSNTMVDDLIEKTKLDYTRTSWMHSHPGLGLFLSAHDLIVQKQLTYSDTPNRLLAIVIDTNSPDWSMALFSPKRNGEMNNKQELKKTISFDDLYIWSRKKAVAQSTNSEYFTLRVNIPGMSTVNFSGKSINQMDDAIYSNKNGIAGYFYGSKRGSDIIIDKCLQYNNVDAIGCLVNDSRSYCDSIPAGLIASVDGSDFVLVCCDTEKMSMFVKKDNFYQKCTQCETTFMEYKEWTRRKRI